MLDAIDRVLIDRDAIAKRVKELGRQISEDYKGKSILMICILRGACVFFSDLVREIDLEVHFDFMAVSSYGNSTRTTGEVKILKDTTEPLYGKDVIIVEDIVDSGITLKNLKQSLMTRKPNSIKICTFLDKPARRQTELVPDYCGFTVPNEFIIGYGMDYKEIYRNVPEVCVLKPEIYQK